MGPVYIVYIEINISREQYIKLYFCRYTIVVINVIYYSVIKFAY